MRQGSPERPRRISALLLGACGLALSGCLPFQSISHSYERTAFAPPASLAQPGSEAVAVCGVPDRVPREPDKVILADYLIEPPDVLRIEATRVLPSRPPISGERTVQADGTISLGLYGTVRVAGLTLAQARAAVAAQLARDIVDPEVSVELQAAHSKCYYVIENRPGVGERYIRLAFTGNETVLDAVSQLGCLPPVTGARRIWIARPVPGTLEQATMLPVDWEAITRRGQMATNYQILPGDRVYVEIEPAPCPSPGGVRGFFLGRSGS